VHLKTRLDVQRVPCRRALGSGILQIVFTTWMVILNPLPAIEQEVGFGRQPAFVIVHARSAINRRYVVERHLFRAKGLQAAKRVVYGTGKTELLQKVCSEAGIKAVQERFVHVLVGKNSTDGAVV